MAKVRQAFHGVVGAGVMARHVVLHHGVHGHAILVGARVVRAVAGVWDGQWWVIGREDKHTLWLEAKSTKPSSTTQPHSPIRSGQIKGQLNTVCGLYFYTVTGRLRQM